VIQAPAIPGHEIPTVPFPPTHGAMDATAQLIFNSVLWVVCAFFLLLALRDWRRSGSPIALLCMVGGGLCIFWEAIVDVMGHCWFWREGNWTMIELFGRPIPSFILPTYIFYLGGQTFYAFRKFQQGAAAREIWKLYAIYFVVDLLLENPPLHWGLYTYYGEGQPLRFGHLPIWWASVNAAMPMVGGALVYRLLPAMQGWKQLFVIALVPMADGITNAAAAWPIWSALNSTENLIVTNAAAFATMGLAALVMWIVTVAVAKDSPLLATSRPAVAPAEPGRLAGVRG
jgi:hypothetical protein